MTARCFSRGSCCFQYYQEGREERDLHCHQCNCFMTAQSERLDTELLRKKNVFSPNCICCKKNSQAKVIYTFQISSEHLIDRNQSSDRSFNPLQDKKAKVKMGELIPHIHHNPKLPLFQIITDCVVFSKLEQQNENKNKQISWWVIGMLLKHFMHEIRLLYSRGNTLTDIHVNSLCNC